MTQLVITAVGPDRPGIVEQFTGLLQKAGGNILDSRMVNLRGQFAMVLLVEAAPEAVLGLEAGLPERAEAMGMKLTLTRQTEVRSAVAGVPMRLKTYSMDQPGIVHRITRVLHANGVNIEELSSRQESAPFDGTPLFLMEMRVTVPTAVAIRKLRGELESLCDSLNCSLDFEPAQA